MQSTRASTAISQLGAGLSRSASAGTFLPRLLSAGMAFPKELEGIAARYRAQLVKIHYRDEVIVDPVLSQMVCDYLTRQTARQVICQCSADSFASKELFSSPVGTLDSELGETHGLTLQSQGGLP